MRAAGRNGASMRRVVVITPRYGRGTSVSRTVRVGIMAVARAQHPEPPPRPRVPRFRSCYVLSARRVSRAPPPVRGGGRVVIEPPVIGADRGDLHAPEVPMVSWRAAGC